MKEPVPRAGPEEPKNTPSLPPVVPKKFTALHAASIAALALLFSIDMKPKMASTPAAGKKSPIVLAAYDAAEAEEIAVENDINACDPTNNEPESIIAALERREKTVEELLSGPIESFVTSIEKLDWSEAAALTTELLELKKTLEERQTEFPGAEELAHLLQGKSPAMREAAHDIAIAILTRRLEDVSGASRTKVAAMRADTGMIQLQRKGALKVVSGLIPSEKSRYFDPKHGGMRKTMLHMTIYDFLQKQQEQGLLKPEQVQRMETWKKVWAAELNASLKADLTAHN